MNEMINLSQAIKWSWEGRDWAKLPVLLPQDTQPQPQTPTPNEQVLQQMIENTTAGFNKQNMSVPTIEHVANNLIADCVVNNTNDYYELNKRICVALTKGAPRKLPAAELKRRLDMTQKEWERKRELLVGTIVDKKWMIFQDAHKQGLITNGHVNYNKDEVLLVADNWNFVSTSKEPDPNPLMASPMMGNRDAIWKDCLDKNSKKVKKYINKLKGAEKGKTCYIVGNGPSLTLNYKELKKINKKNSIIMGMNRCPQLIPDVPLDYYVCIDFKAYPEWVDGVKFKKTKCCFVPTVNPKFIDKITTKEMYWFRHPHEGGVNHIMAEKWGKMDKLDQGLCCTFSAVHLAHYMGCDNIVFVGQDMSFTHGGRHIGEPLPWEMTKHDYQSGTFYMAKDINGTTCMTNKMFCDMRDHLAGACYFLKQGGMRVINASEHGILHGPGAIKHGQGVEKVEIFEQKKLRDIVKELS